MRSCLEKFILVLEVMEPYLVFKDPMGGRSQDVRREPRHQRQESCPLSEYAQTFLLGLTASSSSFITSAVSVVFRGMEVP